VRGAMAWAGRIDFGADRRTGDPLLILAATG
jgi:hypothetical protein